MSYLDRLKRKISEDVCHMEATKVSKAPFVPFVAAEWAPVCQISTATVDREAFEERAAIREFDGGFNRKKAERLAHDDLRGAFRAREDIPARHRATFRARVNATGNVNILLLRSNDRGTLAGLQGPMALQPDCEQTTGYPLRRRCHINPWRGANNSGRATSIKKHRGEGAVVTCVSVTSLMVKFDLLIELAAILQHAKETYL